MRLLSTERLALRPWDEPDLEAFFDLYSRWEVMRWLGPQPRQALASIGEAQGRLARWRERHASVEPPLGLWGIVPAGATESAPVGTVLLMPLADADGPTDEVEVGWHLHPAWQGRGLATEAAQALLHAGAEAGLPRVLAVTDPDNTASQAVARRVGMTDTGLTDRWFGLTLRQFRWDARPSPG